MQSYKKIIFVLLLIFTQAGCGYGLKTLKSFVEERGYIYYADFSTINILGYEVRDNKLRSNPNLSLYGRKGDIPDVTHKKKPMFKIEGSAEIEHFLKNVTKGNITGKFEISAEAEITLEKPFKEEVLGFIPISPCDNHEMSIVTNVLNTGNLKINIKDKRGGNISSTFKLKKAVDTKGEVKIEFGDEITISGEGFYVGYLTELKRCVKVKEKEIILEERFEYYDSEIGIFAFLSATKEKDHMREALVYISPSNFIGKKESAFGILLMLDKERRWAEMLKPGTMLAAIGNPWDEATTLSGEKEIKPWTFTDTQGYKLKFGNHLGIPGIPQVSGLYIEVLSVKEKEVRLKVQHIRYEDVKKRK